MLFSLFLKVPRPLIYTHSGCHKETCRFCIRSSACGLRCSQKSMLHCYRNSRSGIWLLMCNVQVHNVPKHCKQHRRESLPKHIFLSLSPTGVLGSWAVWSHFQESITGRWKLRKIQSTESAWLLKTLRGTVIWGQITHPGAWGTSSRHRGKGCGGYRSPTGTPPVCTPAGRVRQRFSIKAQTKRLTRGLWHSTIGTVNWCWTDTRTFKRILLLNDILALK